MPTGYTSDISEGKEVTRNDFIMGCARQFGALIEMRDLPNGAEIPEFKPSSYQKENIDRYEAKLLETFTIEEAQAAVDEEYQKTVEYNKGIIEKYKALRNRYQSMLDEVLLWEAPSEEHEGLKKFCIEQLQSSIEYDCNDSYYKKLPVKESAELWIISQKENAEKNLKYHQDEWKKELKRIAERNHWVKLLKDSLA